MCKSFLVILSVTGLLTAAFFGEGFNTSPAQPESKGADVTGRWRTARPSPYLITPSAERPQGNPFVQDGLELVERHLNLAFELTERAGGVVVGKNTWTSCDADGNRMFGGSETMLGARDRERLVLVENVDSENDTVQVVFELRAEGPDKLTGIGYQTGSSKLFAARVELIRDPNQ